MNDFLCCLESCQLPSNGRDFGIREWNTTSGGKRGRVAVLNKLALDSVRVALSA